MNKVEAMTKQMTYSMKFGKQIRGSLRKVGTKGEICYEMWARNMTCSYS